MNNNAFKHTSIYLPRRHRRSQTVQTKYFQRYRIQHQRRSPIHHHLQYKWSGKHRNKWHKVCRRLHRRLNYYTSISSIWEIRLWHFSQQRQYQKQLRQTGRRISVNMPFWIASNNPRDKTRRHRYPHKIRLQISCRWFQQTYRRDPDEQDQRRLRPMELRPRIVIHSRWH